MSSTTRPHLVTVFGATGFTGRLTAEYLARRVGGRAPWAIAGRSRDKLEALRRDLEAIDPACAKVGLVEASVDDPASLRAMAAQTVALATTVGPYARYGMPVAEACVDEGAHYADITGEPAFVARVAETLDGKARDRGLRVVSTCGFDSVPHDLGAYFTVKHLPRGEAITLEGFVRSHGTFSGGTWQSALQALSDLGTSARAIRAPRKLEGRRVRGMRPSVRYDADLGAWVCPLPTIDASVVLRSAAAMEEYGPDFRYGHHAEVHSAAWLAGGIVGAGMLAGAAQVPPLRRWLETLKGSGEGPDAAKRARSWFTVTMRGRAGGRLVVTRVRGGDPGYDETAKMLAESALCLAEDDARLAPRHGVLTPAAAMGDALLERLQRAGMVFEVLRG